jgi:hypothetical protein
VNGGAWPRGPVPAGLAARFFRGLYGAYDLHSVRGVYVVVPEGTPVFAGATLTEVAWQISEHASGGKETQ